MRTLVRVDRNSNIARKNSFEDAVAAGAMLNGMIRLGTVVMGVEDVDRAVTFWSTALGYDPIPFDGADDGFTILVPPGGVGTRVAVHRSVAVPQERPRVHIDLIVDSSDEQAAEVARLIGLGASRPPWDYPADPDFVVLSDPDGNRFCVVDASHS